MIYYERDDQSGDKQYDFQLLPVTDAESFFFFSSRRRHTRLQGDWSSDVCSSDLAHLVIHSVATTKAVKRMMAVQLVACLAATPTSPPAASTGPVRASATAGASSMRCAEFFISWRPSGCPG